MRKIDIFDNLHFLPRIPLNELYYNYNIVSRSSWIVEVNFIFNNSFIPLSIRSLTR